MEAVHVRSDIILRPLNIDDAGESLEAVEKNRDVLEKWLPWVEYTRTIEDEKEYIAESINRRKSGKNFEMGVFATTESETKGDLRKWKLIGMCGIVKVYRDHQTSIGELGYWLDQDYIGKGIITSACRKVIELAFNLLKLERIKIMAHQENERSISVARRLNFIPTEQKPEEVNSDFHRDKTKVLVYELRSHDWCSV